MGHTANCAGVGVRPRLVDLLESRSQGRLALLSAPAGWGKTRVVRDWAARSERPVAVVAAATQGLVAPALVDLAAVGVVAVDEADPVGSPMSTSVIDRLLSELPPEVSVVASRRAPWPARIRAGVPGLVGSIEQPELAFTADETRALLGEVADWSGTGQAVDDLIALTSGWVTGLVFAALRARDLGMSDVVEMVEHARRDIGGYLNDAVLDRLTAPERAFVTETSLLRLLDPRVCDVARGRSDSAMFLARLHRRGVVAGVELPGRSVYELHRLLHQHLRERFLNNDPAGARAAAARASGWYLEHDRVENALEQHARVSDWDAILDLVGRYGARLFEHGVRHDTVRLIQSVPVTDRTTDQQLLEYAFMQVWAGHGRAVETSLDRVSSDPGAQMVANMIRAALVRHHLPARVARRAAQSVIDAYQSGVRSTPDIFGITSAEYLRINALHNRGVATWIEGDIRAARSDLESAVHPRPEYGPWIVRGVGAIAALEAHAGRLRIAETHAREALEAAETFGMQRHKSLGDSLLALARVERERNRLVTAEVHLTRGRAIADHYREPTTLLQIETEAALLGLANGTPHTALQRLQEWLRIYDAAPISRFHQIAQATEARLLLAMDQPDKAARSLPDDPETDPDCSAVAIHLALLEHQPDRAARILDAWPQLDERRSRLEHQLWRAVYLYRRGERSAALTGLDEILPEATADGHVRLFIDGGPLVRDLLRAALPTRREQVAPLMNAWGDPAVGRSGAPGDEITVRELQVLRFLPTRLSARDIAARLYISNNTLKTHLRNIYRKLDVNDRDQAAHEAERLGLA